jgi:acyl-coenzyme A thioesterase PaaI-like protein
MPETPSAPFTAYLGGVLERTGADSVCLTVQTAPHHADRWGRVHTGVLTAIMDSVIGIGLGRMRAERGDAGPHATIDMNTSFYAAATPGDHVTCEGRITLLAEHFAFGEVEARRTDDGELLAKARLTFAIPGRRALRFAQDEN